MAFSGFILGVEGKWNVLFIWLHSVSNWNSVCEKWFIYSVNSLDQTREVLIQIKKFPGTWKLTFKLLYGRSINNLAATDGSLTSWLPADVDGGKDVNDTDCFIGLVESNCLSVILDSIFPFSIRWFGCLVSWAKFEIVKRASRQYRYRKISIWEKFNARFFCNFVITKILFTCTLFNGKGKWVNEYSKYSVLSFESNQFQLNYCIISKFLRQMVDNCIWAQRMFKQPC